MLLRFKKRRKETVEGFYIKKKKKIVLLNGIFEISFLIAIPRETPLANQKVFPCY